MRYYANLLASFCQIVSSIGLTTAFSVNTQISSMPPIVKKETHRVQPHKNYYTTAFLDQNWDDDSHSEDIPDHARPGGQSRYENVAYNSTSQCIVDLERRIRLLQIWAWLEGLIIIILLLSLILKPLYQPAHNSNVRLGSDPSGFVPKGMENKA